MHASPPESFYKNYVKAIHEGNAAIFAGAGLSRSAGYVDWRGLLRDIAQDLGLDIDRETDLIAVAQYHENKHRTRTQLNRAIIEEFTKDAALTENHRLIANLPLDTVWTTNYDDLIEQAFREVGKRVDVKISPENLANPKPGRSVTVYKMHGDISQPHDAIITKEDYETYDFPSKRELFSIKLKGDLVGRTFLFVGFSFTDPNIDYILSRIRALLGKNQGQHYCVMKKPSPPKGHKVKKNAVYEYEKTKLELRTQDLRRYGIEPVLIDEYADISSILREINRRSHLKDVFVSGSYVDPDPLGESRINELTRMLGFEIIKYGFNLVSGFGVGIGENAIVGALDGLYTSGSQNDTGDRLFLRPFPQHAPKGMSIAEFWTGYRKQMLSKCGVCVFISGNKAVSGKVVQADGVLEEFEIAKKLGKVLIPIGASGHAAQRIWNVVMLDLDKFFPAGGIKKHFQVLGNSKSSNKQLIDAVISILKTIKAL